MSTKHTDPKDKGVTTGQDGSNHHESRNDETGDDALRLALPLWEIDPETLPEEPGAAWEEVARRITAYLDDRDGWRTGEIESTFDEFGGDDR